MLPFWVVWLNIRVMFQEQLKINESIFVIMEPHCNETDGTVAGRYIRVEK